MEKDLEIIQNKELPLFYREMVIDSLITDFFINKLKFTYNDYIKVITNIKEDEILISIPINKTEYKTLIIPYTDSDSIIDNLYLQTLGLKPYRENIVNVDEEFFKE